MKKITIDTTALVKDTVTRALLGKVSKSTLEVLVDHLVYVHEDSFENFTTFSQVNAFLKKLEEDCKKYIHTSSMFLNNNTSENPFTWVQCSRK